MAYTIRQYETKSGKRYEVRYRKPDGSATGKRGFKRKMDADAWGAANVTTAKSVGAYIDPQAGRRLVEDFWEPWLAAKKDQGQTELHRDAGTCLARARGTEMGHARGPVDHPR